MNPKANLAVLDQIRVDQPIPAAIRSMLNFSTHRFAALAILGARRTLSLRELSCYICSMKLARLPFFDQNCELTLREAVKIHLENLPTNGVTTSLSDPQLAKLFEGHDTCHVVFGCSTSLVDEGMVDTWSIIGSTVTLRQYWDYMNYPEVKKILSEAYKEHGLLKLTWLYLRATPYYLQVIFRAFTLRKKWPFFDHERFQDWTLRELRKEFGIQVVDRLDRGP